MSLRPENLPRDADALIAMVMAQAVEIEVLRTALKTMKALIFGARSEKMAVILDAQLALNLDDLCTDVPITAANDDEVSSPVVALHRRKKARRNLGHLPKHLPRIEEVIEPAVTTCPCCAGLLHKIGEDVAEALDAVPAVLRVLRTIRPKYACRACTDAIVQAPARARLIDGGMATTALMSNVAVWKFAWHMPLSRQVQMLAGQGIVLDRSTLSKWIKRVAWWLAGLYQRQIEIIHTYPRLFCDETRMPVRRAGERRTHTGQFWTHAIDDRPWCGPAPPAVVYIYAGGRGHQEIKQQLARCCRSMATLAISAWPSLAVPPAPFSWRFVWLMRDESSLTSIRPRNRPLRRRSLRGWPWFMPSRDKSAAPARSIARMSAKPEPLR